MKKTLNSLQKKIELKRVNPFPKVSSYSSSFSPLPLTWLISSILFFFIATVVAPLFWPQLDKVDKVTEFTASHIILGISGIIVYILEPIIWHNTMYGTDEKKIVQEPVPDVKKESWFLLITELVISTALGLLISLPYVCILIFKPVLRAMILYVSLSFLNLGSGNLGEHPVFVIIVTADILLYYLGMIAPKWKFNPVNALAGLIKIKNRRAARYAGSILLIIHTALIYALLLNMVYYDIIRHPEKLNLKNLALWWLILTVYSRMSFITDDFDVNELFKNVPLRIILINLLALVISFISFIWPFYFA
ncbi:MAG: hypothetical protein WBB06_14915 [Chitinophagaceae bacterium]